MYVIGCIVLLFTVLGFSQNLLNNPGFESWSNGLPDSWDVDTGVFLHQEVTIVHGGEFSVRESLITQNQEEADLFQGPFSVEANREYTFSIWVFDDDPAGRLRHGIQWFPTGSDWGTHFSQDSTFWQKLTLTVISPPEAESALALIRAYDTPATWDGDAILYVDDGVVETSVVQPPVILRIWHLPVNPDSQIGVEAYGYVSDDGTIIADTLFYGVNDLDDPLGIPHAVVYNDTFRYTLPGQPGGDTVFYYMKFTDDDDQVSFSDTAAYFVGDLMIYINEVLYDTPGSDAGCFIELHGVGSTELNDVSLVGVRGSSGSEYNEIGLSGYTIPNDGFFVIAQDTTVPNSDLVTSAANLQNGPDNLELRFHGITVDALGYGELDGWYFTGEWKPAIDVPAGHSLGRYPNGFDSDDNSFDFHDYSETSPGIPNPDIGVQCRTDRAKRTLHLPNPVRSGSDLKMLFSNSNYFPIIVYNSIGQLVHRMKTPNENLELLPGIYFIKSSALKEVCYKIIVVQ